jgi:hypothetical protein
MRRLVALVVLSSFVIVASPMFAEASVVPHSKTTTIRLFSKNLSSSLTTAAGAAVPENDTPIPGDKFTAVDANYHGDHTHHSNVRAGSDVLYCVVTGATKTAVEAECIGIVAIGNSILYSEESANLESQSKVMVSPVTGGTGVFEHATGRVVTVSVGNNTDFTIQIKTP